MGLSPSEALEWCFSWERWRRDDQCPPPGDWFTWFYMAGRGAGKTWTGAHWANAMAMGAPGSRGALMGATVADVRGTMILGESGILAVAHPDRRPRYTPSRRLLEWPNGSIALTFSADAPNQPRGPQQHWAWADEPGKFRFPDAWDNLLMGTRLGPRPRICATSTPRNTPLIRSIARDPTTAVRHATTYANRDHLPQPFLAMLRLRYEGTNLGRQELLAQLLEDAEGALWQRAWIERDRVATLPDLTRVVVAVDPQAMSTSGGETGIVVGGLGEDGHGYIIDDRSLSGTPLEWATAVAAAHAAAMADVVVAEINNGGEMVESTIRVVAPRIAYKALHASRGKYPRAQPVAALYEQGLVHHLGGFPELEDELCQWEPDAGMPSPNRLDALVWCVTELMLEDDRRPRSERLAGLGGTASAGLPRHARSR